MNNPESANKTHIPGPSGVIVNLDKEVLETMKSHAESTFPNECVGFLYGKDGDTRSITIANPIDNAKDGDQSRRFEVSPYDYMHAEKFAMMQGIDLLGIYHSHPNHVAIPSIHDLKQAVPFFSYIIVSVREGSTDHIRSWRLNDDNIFLEEELVHL